MTGHLLDQASNQFVACRSGKERRIRIMQHFTGEKMSIVHGNVRKIRDDQIKSFGQIFEEITFLNSNTLT